jgi:hypothetical protein
LGEEVCQFLCERLVELETMIADGKEQPDTREVQHLLKMRGNRPAPERYGKGCPTLDDFGQARRGMGECLNDVPARANDPRHGAPTLPTQRMTK